MTLRERVNTYYDRLTDSDLHILNYILKEDLQFDDLTIDAFSKMSSSSNATVYRLIKKLGFDGYSEFKYAMIQENKQDPVVLSIDYKQVILENIRVTLEGVNQDSLNELLQAIHTADERYVFGTGWKQAKLLELFSNDMFTYHKPFINIQALNDFDRIARRIQPNSLVIVSSLSGNTESVAEIMQYLTLKGVTTVSLTSYGLNEIAQSSKLRFYFNDDSIHSSLMPWPGLTLKALLDYFVYSYLDLLK